MLVSDIHVEDDLRPAVLGRGLSATTDEPTKFHGSSPTQSSRRLVCSLRIAIDAKEKAGHHANTIGTLSLVPLGIVLVRKEVLTTRAALETGGSRWN